MLHHVARARPGRLLFSTYAEGCALWRYVAIPGASAVCIMPNHVHVLHPTDVRLVLANRLSAYVRWRQALNGLGGSLLEPLPDPVGVVGDQKVHTIIRYIHLNPCRAHLVTDPLAWPFSTHRDYCGLVANPLVEPRGDTARFHEYVSSDPTAAVAGTDLYRIVTNPLPVDVLAATTAVLRVPQSDLMIRGPARSVYVGMARELCPNATNAEIGRIVALGADRVCRIRIPRGPAARAIRLVAGDRRYELLDDQDLRLRHEWFKFRRHSP